MAIEGLHRCIALLRNSTTQEYCFNSVKNNLGISDERHMIHIPNIILELLRP